jgi:hypothetical protein
MIKSRSPITQRWWRCEGHGWRQQDRVLVAQGSMFERSSKAYMEIGTNFCLNGIATHGNQQ